MSAPAHVLPMGASPVQSFSPEQLEARRKTLGASEIPVVAGLVPFKSPIQLWLEKRGVVKSFEGNEFTEWGNRLEAIVAEKYAEVRNVVIERSSTIVHPTEGWMSCTPDRLVPSLSRGLEVKCRGEYRGDEWGEPGTDEVPFDVAVQCHWSMIVTGLTAWDVATLIGGNKFRMYELHYDPEIAESLIAMGREFWFDHVLAGVQPPIDGSTATTELLKERYAIARAATREASQQEAAWIEGLCHVRAEIKTLEEQEQQYKNLLMDAIGDAEGLTSPAGKVLWRAPGGTITSYKDAFAELAERFAPKDEAERILATYSKAQSRRFTVTAPKGGK